MTDVLEQKKVFFQLGEELKDELETNMRITNELVTLKDMLENLGYDETTEKKIEIPFKQYEKDDMETIVKYVDHHLKHPDEKIGANSLTEFDTELLGNDPAKVLQIMLMANFLDCQPLLDAACQTVANIIKSKTKEEIEEMFKNSEILKEEEEACAKERAELEAPN